jgi:phosphatidylserine/phosphatidylglycerophosphate/cardiolipin synthase-like enzyme
VAAGLLFTSCGGSQSTKSRDASSTSTPPRLESVIDSIRSMEQQTGSDSLENVAWSLSGTNTLPANWIVQTHGCFGATVCDSSVQQELMTSTIGDIVANGEQLVDLSGLAHFPDGGFLDAIVEGARRADSAGRRPVIRMLWGNTPGFDIGNRELFELQSMIQAAAPNLEIVVVTMATTPVLNGYEWNHSKIVAADGRVAFVSGINMWANDYLRSDSPVTDVGVIVEGPAAAAAQEFLSAQWRHVCANLGTGFSYTNNMAPASPPGGCPSGVSVPTPTGSGSTPILAIGRLGYQTDGKTFARNAQRTVPMAKALTAQCLLPPQPNPNNGDPGWDGRNPSDTAIRALLATATQDIVLSGQDVIFKCGIQSEDIRLFETLADRLIAGVSVTIVVSNPNAKPSGTVGILKPEGSYSGPDAAALQGLLRRYVADRVGSVSAADLTCKLLSVAPLRVNETASWPGQSGAKGEPGLHTKLYMVDSEAFYVGSQNLYPNQLTEFGYMIDDADAAGQVRSSLLDPILRYSLPAKVGC